MNSSPARRQRQASGWDNRQYHSPCRPDYSEGPAAEASGSEARTCSTKALDPFDRLNLNATLRFGLPQSVPAATASGGRHSARTRLRLWSFRHRPRHRPQGSEGRASSESILGTGTSLASGSEADGPSVRINGYRMACRHCQHSQFHVSA